MSICRRCVAAPSAWHAQLGRARAGVGAVIAAVGCIVVAIIERASVDGEAVVTSGAPRGVTDGVGPWLVGAIVTIALAAALLPRTRAGLATLAIAAGAVVTVLVEHDRPGFGSYRGVFIVEEPVLVPWLAGAVVLLVATGVLAPRHRGGH